MCLKHNICVLAREQEDLVALLRADISLRYAAKNCYDGWTLFHDGKDGYQRLHQT